MKHIKFYKNYLLLLLIALIFNACQSSFDKKNIAKINLAEEPASIDPAKVHTIQGMTVVKALFEGLTRIDANNQLELALAKQVEISEDLKTYTFHLRPSKWTNGERVVAEDFVYAWKRALAPTFLSAQAFQLYPIKNAKAIKRGELSSEALGVKALNALTLQVELEEPLAYFLKLTALPIFLPIPSLLDQANSHWSKEAKNYVGNGPFLLKTWEHHNSLLLEKNASYWDQKQVKLSFIEMSVIQDNTTELQLFEKKELDWAGSPLSALPLDAVPGLKAESRLYEKPLLGTLYICINTQLPLFNSASVRRALAEAIDRKEIIEHITYGTQLSAKNFVPPCMGLKEGFFSIKSTGGFKGLLHTEQQQEITLLYPAGERNHLIAQAIQHQWVKAFDMQFKLKALEKKAYYARLAQKDFQLSLCSFIADFEDPINFLETFKYKREAVNRTSWENSSYIDLLEKAKNSIDLMQRAEFLNQSEELLHSEMPIIPLFHYNALYLKNESLHDVVISPLGIMDFKWAYFESEVK